MREMREITVEAVSSSAGKEQRRAISCALRCFGADSASRRKTEMSVKEKETLWP